MNYDKNVFIAGIAVGRQLKGWSEGRVGIKGGVKAQMRRAVLPSIQVSATVPSEFGASIALSFERVPPTYIIIGTRTVPAALGETTAAAITQQTVPTTSASASIPSAINAAIEVTNIVITETNY